MLKKILPLIGILIIALVLFLVLSPRENGDRVRVTVDGALYGEFPLDEERRITLGGGTNTFVIENGRVKMEEADCPDKICIRQGWISHTSECITCLPNRVVLEIIKSSDEVELVV